jgi:hypothetical protein
LGTSEHKAGRTLQAQNRRLYSCASGKSISIPQLHSRESGEASEANKLLMLLKQTFTVYLPEINTFLLAKAS